MPQCRAATYSLPLAATKVFAQESLGKLKVARSPDGGAVLFDLLDYFDLPLLGSGRVLLESESALVLLTADGRVLRQAAKRAGNFVADLNDGPVKRALKDLSPLRCLLSVGSGEMRQEAVALLDDAQKTQCRARLRILTTTDGGALLVSVQGLRRDDKAADLMYARLQAAGGQSLNDNTLFARLFPGRVAYRAKPQVDITAGKSAFDTANDIIAAHIPVARANEAGIIADHDTEFLHDYRVALRKIRSVLSLFKGIYETDQTENLKFRFTELMTVTGRLRDLDVYLLEKQTYYELLPGHLHVGLDMLFNRFDAERHAQQGRLATHLRSESYERETGRLERLFARRKKLIRGPKADLSARDYAGALIWKRYNKVCKAAAGIVPETDDTEIHALRIHCKKLRYLTEIFAPAFPEKQVKDLIRPLKRLQDTLGLFNDYAVQQDSLAAILRQPDTGHEDGILELAQSIGALIAMLHRRQTEERAKIIDSFAPFDSEETRRAFRTLFKATN